MKKLLVTVLSIALILALCPATFAKTSSTTNTIESPAQTDSEEELHTQRLVYNAAWFRPFRTVYRGYDAHLTYNTALDNGEYIYGQRNCPQYAIGTEYMADVGCEIAATFNALKRRGLIIPVSNIIYSFEKNGYLMASGLLGSDPYAIGDYLEDCLVPYTQYTSYYSMNNQVTNNAGTFQVYIVSYWNNANTIGSGLHTVAFVSSSTNTNIYFYNLNTNGTALTTHASFTRFMPNDDLFIVGYHIPQLHSKSAVIDVLTNIQQALYE